MSAKPVVLPGGEGTITFQQVSPKGCGDAIGIHSCGGVVNAIDLNNGRHVVRCHYCCLRVNVPSALAKDPESFAGWCADQVLEEERARKGLKQETLWPARPAA